MRRKSKESIRWSRRVMALGLLFSLWGLAVILRLYYLQVPQNPLFLSRAESLYGRTLQDTPRRGNIYDRNGTPIAISVAVDSLYAVPAEIPNPDLAARLLARILSLPAKDLAARLRSNRHFIWIKRKVTATEISRMEALQLTGIYTRKEMKRFYPQGRLAAQVLGSVGMDGAGLAGIEYKFNHKLQGPPGRLVLATGTASNLLDGPDRSAPPGQGVVLTLDEKMQYIAEKALDRVVAQFRPSGATVVVQDPFTGHILAMANRPSYNPNDFRKTPERNWMNRAVAWTYEPGSTLKIVTFAASLEENLTTPQEWIDCQNGSLLLAGHRFHDHNPFDSLTSSQVLAQSSNVGTIKLALRVGKKRLYRYLDRLGFGRPTGIRLPGESRGLLRPPRKWSKLSLASLSLGHEIGVTPVQLVTAYSAIANGGTWMQPKIFRGYRDRERLDPVQDVPGKRILQPSTAQELKRMLALVVEEGTGRRARPAGYSAAGKTGTAQKIDATGRYSDHEYVASFVGFAPVDRPAVTVLVVVDSPSGAIYGAEVAAPVFKSITEQILAYLNVPHAPAFENLQLASSAGGWNASSLEEDDRAKSRPNGPGRPVPPLQPLQQVSLKKLSLLSSAPTLFPATSPGIEVPDFSGRPLREAVRQGVELGLKIRVRGSGQVIRQFPEAGSRLAPGDEIRLNFGR